MVGLQTLESRSSKLLSAVYTKGHGGRLVSKATQQYSTLCSLYTRLWHCSARAYCARGSSKLAHQP